MNTLLELENVRIQVGEKVLLENVCMNFYEGISTFFCGTSGSGKTLLLKAINGEIKYQGKINKYANVEVVLNRNHFFTNTIEDELRYLVLTKEEKEIVHEFITIEDLKKDPNTLSLEMQKILLLLPSLIKKPNLLFIDSLFSFISEKKMEQVFDYAKKKRITLVSVSTQIEESVFYPYMIVMNQGKIAIEGKTYQVLEEEKLLKRLGIGVPFLIDLSIQLQHYNLLHKLYFTKEEMVSALWK